MCASCVAASTAYAGTALGALKLYAGRGRVRRWRAGTSVPSSADGGQEPESRSGGADR